MCASGRQCKIFKVRSVLSTRLCQRVLAMVPSKGKHTGMPNKEMPDSRPQGYTGICFIGDPTGIDGCRHPSSESLTPEATFGEFDL